MFWASMDLLFGSLDSLARFPARGEGRKGGARKMSELSEELRSLFVLWSDDEAESVNHTFTKHRSTIRSSNTQFLSDSLMIL